MGLRARLILIVTLGLGVSLAASLGVLLRLDDHDERRQTSQRTAALLSGMAAPISVLLTQGRVADIDNLMGELGHRADQLGLDGIVLLDAHGVVLAETTKDRRAQERFGRNLAAEDPFIAQAIVAAQALQDPPSPARPRRVSVPVQTGVRWATLVGVIDEAAVERALAARRERLLASAVAVSSLGLFVLLLLLSIEVLSPIAGIVRMAERLAAGDLKARAPVAGAVELQTLATTLNDAARKLAGVHEQLEEQVAVRTEELRAANERLEKLALTDPLTGLFNRRYLDQLLALEVTRQRRHKRPFSLLIIDVDHFKRYNDKHGHPRGDEVLRQMAGILTSNLRSSDIVARIGGEEFVAVLLDVELPVAMVAASKLRAAVEAHPFPLERVTVSLGLASWPKNGETADEVIEAADKALYASKAAGRNRVTAASHSGVTS